MSLLLSPFFRPRADRNGLCVLRKHFDCVRIKTYTTSYVRFCDSTNKAILNKYFFHAGTTPDPLGRACLEGSGFALTFKTKFLITRIMGGSNEDVSVRVLDGHLSS